MSPDRLPPVGWNVQFFHSADRAIGAQAALVTHVDQHGILTLTVFPRGGGDTDVKTGVRHMDDPWLDTHRDAKLRFGGWDFIPGHEYKLPKTAKQMSPDEIRDRVLQLHAEGHASDAIAGKMSLQGLGKNRVAEIVRQAEKETAGV